VLGCAVEGGQEFVKEKVVYCFVCFSWTLYTFYSAVAAVDFHEECGFHCAVFHETCSHSSEVSCVVFPGTECYPNEGGGC